MPVCEVQTEGEIDMELHELKMLELKLAAETIRRGGDASKIYAAFEELYGREEDGREV